MRHPARSTFVRFFPLVLAALGAASLGVGTACSKRAAGSGAPGDEARRIFEDQCATCHGVGGHGDGPAARALGAKPRDYTDVGWQKSVTDDQLRTVIVKGGAAVGKSAQMPPSPQLADRPEVVDALVAIVRAFGKADSPRAP